MKYKVTLHGHTYEVEVEHGKAILEDEYEAYAPSAPSPAPAPAPTPAAPAPAPASAASPVVTAAGEPINAPLPGTVLRVEVSQGAAVKAGQILVVLEAMKMENEVLSPRDGTVAQVVCAKGANVQTGDPLIILA